MREILSIRAFATLGEIKARGTRFGNRGQAELKCT